MDRAVGTPRETAGASSPLVRRCLAGVFEGGGAKGLAYEEALTEVEAAGLWFTAVAGASAGAITAALVGAGCSAEEIAVLSTSAMNCLAGELALPVGRLRRLAFLWRRMRSLASESTAAAASSDVLETWLREQLVAKVGGTDPTFADLYASTSIELTMVAVDIHHRQHRVFNYAWSPNVSVASAAVASSSIPFALPPRRLLVEADSTYASPIVDGGVWTNFPMFVFEDPEFRTFHHLPQLPKETLVVGFLLDESAAPTTAPEVTPAGFVKVSASMRSMAGRTDAAADDKMIGPSELLLTYAPDEVEAALRNARKLRSANSTLAGWLDRSTSVPGMRATKLTPEARRATEDDGKGAATELAGDRTLYWLIDGLRLSAMPLYTAVMIVGSILIPALPALALLRFVDAGVWWTRTLWWIGLLAAVTLWLFTTPLFIATTIGNAVLYWPLRRFGGLIAATYLAGSGAPYWTGRADAVDHVIVRLPIPSIAHTTSFGLPQEMRRSIVSNAGEITRQALSRPDGVLDRLKSRGHAPSDASPSASSIGTSSRRS